VKGYKFNYDLEEEREQELQRGAKQAVKQAT